MTTAVVTVSEQIAVGTRVTFDSIIHGRQTGTVHGLMPDSALVDIDHRQPGMRWAVPLKRLRILPGEAG